MRQQPSKSGLSMRSYTIRVRVIPPKFTGLPPYHEVRTIVGRSLKDAKRRAGIQ